MALLIAGLTSLSIGGNTWRGMKVRRVGQPEEPLDRRIRVIRYSALTIGLVFLLAALLLR
ncbi:MAG TPA: hypothetical protein VF160_10880 [Candidatus Dormibacteraeota bacterium]